MKRKIKRNAWNRGTAVHLGGAKVRFIWPCDCTRVETMKENGRLFAADAVALLVKNWRANGVTLEQCKKHPDWHSNVSEVARLNAAHPAEGGIQIGGTQTTKAKARLGQPPRTDDPIYDIQVSFSWEVRALLKNAREDFGLTEAETIDLLHRAVLNSAVDIERIHAPGTLREPLRSMVRKQLKGLSPSYAQLRVARQRRENHT